MLVEYDDSVAVAVQARVLPRAPEQTWGRPVGAGSGDHRRGARSGLPAPGRAEGARVELWPGRDGMATLAACLSAPEATASYEWITRLARGVRATHLEDICGVAEDGEVVAGRGRGSMDRRRADVLVALLTGRLVATSPAATATTRAGKAAKGYPSAHRWRRGLCHRRSGNI